MQLAGCEPLHEGQLQRAFRPVHAGHVQKAAHDADLIDAAEETADDRTRPLEVVEKAETHDGATTASAAIRTAAEKFIASLVVF